MIYDISDYNFQYQLSAIEGRVLVGVIVSYKFFNTSLVQLKDKGDDTSVLRIEVFNTSLVQLKGIT